LGLIPCGLGARDTLRLEAGMPLYGHEMNDDITPLETGLDMFVKMDKPDFIGKRALLDKGTPAVTRIGLEMMDRGIAREDCPVYAGGDLVGRTTSGTHCPFMQKALAMALVDRQHAVPGTELTVEVRGRRLKAKVIPLPFYKRSAQ
jgi:aminomethyltransferase